MNALIFYFRNLRASIWIFRCMLVTHTVFILFINHKTLHQGFPNFFQMAPFKELRFKKATAPSKKTTQKFTIKNTRDIFFCCSFLTHKNIQCKFQTLTSWLPCGCSFAARSPPDYFSWPPALHYLFWANLKTVLLMQILTASGRRHCGCNLRNYAETWTGKFCRWSGTTNIGRELLTRAREWTKIRTATSGSSTGRAPA